MGYTHYWRTHEAIPADVWNKIMDDANKLIAASPCPLAYENDQPNKKPEVTANFIRFNGVGDGGHETFFLSPAPTEFEFCKTANKPYDTVVVGVLASLAEHARDNAKVTSDGDSTEWADGIAFASRTLGRSIRCPIKNEPREDAY